MRACTIRQALAALVGALAGAAFGADPTPVGDQFRVNAGQLGSVDHPDIAAGAAGNFVVAWEGGDYSSWFPIFVRTFDADGNPVSGNVEVSPPGQNSPDRSYGPALATDADGNFVVVWNQGEDYEVQARQGDAAGNLAPTFTVAEVETYEYSHAVSSTPAGEFVVAWSNSVYIPLTTTYSSVFARRYDPSGTPTGSVIEVRSDPEEQRYSASSIAMHPDGQFVVTWAEPTGIVNPWQLRAQRFDAADAPVGAEIAVASNAREEVYEPSQRHAIAPGPSGSFVVAWEAYPFPHELFAQRFNASGAAIGPPLLVGSNGYYPDVAVGPNGDFAVVWHDENRNIQGRHFSAAISTFGSTFQVNDSGSGYFAAVATTPDGFVVAWTGEGGGPGYDYGVFGRRFTVSSGGSVSDVGISAEKLIIVDNLAAAGKAKTVYVSKLDAGIAKGLDGDPALLSGSFQVFYTDAPAVAGLFVLPAPWQKNEGIVAKYVNTLAPGAPGDVKVAVVKDGLLAKVAAKGLGDGPAIDLSAGPPSPSGGVTTVLAVANGNEPATRRLCTRFATADGSFVEYKPIAQGSGYKLVARGGVPAACS